MSKQTPVSSPVPVTHGANDRSLALIVVAAAIVYGLWIAYVVAGDRPTDFNVYLISTEALANGVNIYRAPSSTYDEFAARLHIQNYSPPYVYPLLTALAIMPLRALPRSAAQALWLSGSALAALVAALLLARRARAAWPRRIVLLASLGFVPIFTTLYAGQVNLWPLLLTTLAVEGWRTDRDLRSGAWLALGLWVKPLALVLVGWAGWRLRIHTFAGIALVSGALFVISWLVFGIEAASDQFQSGTGSLQLVGQLAYPTNQNLNGMFSRWFTLHEYGVPLLNAPALAVGLYVASSTLMVAMVTLLLWPFGARAHDVGLETALIVSTTHLIAPLAWYHHLSMLLIAFAPLVVCGEHRSPRTWSMIALGVAYLLIEVYGLLWHRLVGVTLLLDLATWGQLILWLLLVSALYRTRRVGVHQISISPQNEKLSASH